MKISVLCSDAAHPVYPWLERWCNLRAREHSVELVDRKSKLHDGDLLFLISCHEVIDSAVLSRYLATLVIHASDLPEGRGWSPHIWQILEGRSEIVVTLLEAEGRVDSGRIWAKRVMHLEGHELFDEINEALFSTEMELMDYAVDNFGRIEPRPQDSRAATYHRRRTPEDSRLDPYRTLADQFDLLRVADPTRFPAFFDFRGNRYLVRIDKDKGASE